MSMALQMSAESGVLHVIATELMERFYYGEFAARTVMYYFVDSLRSPLFAYVLKEPVLDLRRFGETVAVNRGMQVRAAPNGKSAPRKRLVQLL